MQRLHLQTIFKILSTSFIVVSNILKTYFGWDKRGKAPCSYEGAC